MAGENPRRPLLVRASAPGKAILFGEHAVVRGAPAVAAAIGERLTVTLDLSVDRWIVDGKPLIPAEYPHISALLIRMLPRHLGPGSFTIQSELPRASGLGSSAALAVAAAATLRAYVGRWKDESEWVSGFGPGLLALDGDGPWDDPPDDVRMDGARIVFGGDAIEPEEITRIAHIAEAESQGGRASPIDTATATLGGVVVVGTTASTSLTPLEERIIRSPDGTEHRWSIGTLAIHEQAPYLVLADTGERSSTAKMVAHVANRIEESDRASGAFDSITEISEAGIEALSQGDWPSVQNAILANQEALLALDIVTDKAQELIDIVGPEPAKITGAGGGGCILALSHEPEVLVERLKRHASGVYIAQLGASGVQLNDVEFG